MDRVVIFGSTSEELHIGCKALIQGLEGLIKERFEKNVIIQHISHRFLSNYFYESLLGVKIERSGFFSKKEYSLQVEKSYSNWEQAYYSMFKKDVFLKLTFDHTDIVIINVEGTIHHQAILGLQLLAIGKMACDLGKDVYWVNFSTQSENKAILKSALWGAKRIAVREIRSYSYLKSLGINAIQSFDTAVLAPFNNITYKLTVLENNEYCLFTGSNIKKYDLLKIAEEINIKGFVPLYIPMGLNDFKDFTELKKSNILSLDFSQVNLSQLIYLIKNSKFVISGRHHLNIFSLMAEKPFIPLESNTWKIAGVCELLDIQPKFNMDLSDKIDDIIIYHHTYRKNLESKIHKSKELAKLNF